MSVRTRRTRLAVLAATAVLGATIPVLGGATTAWACGDDQPAAAAPASAPAASASASAPAAPASAPAAPAPAAAPAADVKLRVDSIWRDADTITAGGAPVQIGVEISNGGTETIDGVQPFPTFFNDSGDPKSILHPEDLVLEVKTGGAWKTLPMKWGCDPTLRGDYSSLATDLAPGQTVRFVFRLSVTTHSNEAQQKIDVSVGVRAGQVAPIPGKGFVLPIVHPAAPATPAPTATSKAPSTPAATPSAPTTPAQTPGAKDAAGPAVVPAALLGSTTPSPASVPAGTGNLASTGGGSSSTPMLIGGTALVLLGAGAVVFAARRRAAAHRG
ncbi:LAETG motif-containing sortase-dependent surface protein [Kitasatospora sp. NPDC059673]|uniref:LAETG motif-containing sortase-dependent surface protein n=1 Tax=Kitasatospora sp. NPDC059673 TaxID=3346901 RepID=UPI00369B9080